MFSLKGMTPIDRELSKRVVKIIHSLLMMQQSAAFRKPVAHKALGLQDYKLIVKKPTDLNLIRRQNNEGKYKFVEEILDQIQLCWDNCKLYNAIGSEIYSQSLHLEKTFDKLGLEFLPEFWTGINREEYNLKFNEKKIEQEKLKKPQNKAITKHELPAMMVEQPLKQKSKKQVTFQAKQFLEQQEDMQQEGSFRQDLKKDREEIMQNEPVQSVPAEMANADKGSMDVEEGEEGQQVAVEPIMVNLSQNPTRQQLVQLSEFVKNVYAKQEYSMLQKVLQILHSNEKQNMSLNKNGLMSFKMSKIHISTYYRIKKLVGAGEENISIIE